ncbi:hypothetical protein PQR71_14025 [Paraburkholderia fungorum]|uniref:hypothetical protein n=1 Tax=Paraburkholderia fungorum TaxID=134537 RepID=UPI0038B7E527
MTDINAPTLPALRIKAWRALVVHATNTALHRRLFMPDCPPDFPAGAKITLNTDIQILGRPFTLWIEDAGVDSLRFDVFELKRHLHAAWNINRRGGLSIQIPGKRKFDWLNGFSRDEQAELAAMPVEPIGYGFSKQGENYAR